jgi:hypothetical protein
MLEDFDIFRSWFVVAFSVGMATAAVAFNRARRRSVARWLVWFSAVSTVAVLAVEVVQEDSFYVVVGVACSIAFLIGASVVAAALGAFGKHQLRALSLLASALLLSIVYAEIKLPSRPLVVSFEQLNRTLP